MARFAPTLFFSAAALLALATTAALEPRDPALAAAAWLAALWTVRSTLLGALALLSISRVAPIRWLAAFRPALAAACESLPLLLLAILPLFGALSALYPWARPQDPTATEHAARALDHLRTWLSPVPFAIRSVGYAAVDGALGVAVARSSGRVGARWSAFALVILAVTWPLCAMDEVLSLDAPATSSIFGSYVFAGGFSSALALLVVAARLGAVDVPVPRDAWHALGRMVLAFAVLWAYLAYSQLFIAWIADTGSEVPWLIPRVGAWRPVAWAVAIGGFGVPCALMLSRAIQRDGTALAVLCGLLLAGHALEGQWLVVPALYPDAVVIRPVQATALLGLVSAFLAVASWRFRVVAREPVEPTLAYRAS